MLNLFSIWEEFGMDYKTILVHIDGSRHLTATMELASQLAIGHEAHLIGVTTTGVSRYLYESFAPSIEPAGLAPYLDTLQHEADERAQRFEAFAQHAGVASFEKRVTDDEPAGALAMQARYADLVVLGQYDPDGEVSSVYADVPEYVAMNGGCPVLVVPYAGNYAPSLERVLIGWNASPEASKAVRQALPFLRLAKIVEIAIFNGEEQGEALGEQPGADIALFLSRHGIKNIDVRQERIDGDVGEALLSLAANLQSELLVMGCYGHSRFREIFLSGASRTVLRSMTLPTLLAH
jgi:nucleotide-binding universal stress UspA family protein